MFGLTPAILITRTIVLLVAMVVHEYAHAYVAYRMGDSTAKEQGRMTLDPRANIYPIGFLFGVLVGFAVLGSAPVNRYRMRNPRWGMFWAVLAGPVSNLLLAIVFALPLRFGLVPASWYALRDTFLLPAPITVWWQMIFMNVLLFVFNLLPLAPLDGWTVVLSALPPRPATWWQRNQQQSTYVLFGLIALSFIVPQLAATVPVLRYLDLLTLLIGVPSHIIVNLLLGV